MIFSKLRCYGRSPASKGLICALALTASAPFPDRATSSSALAAAISTDFTGTLDPGYVPGLHVRVILSERRLRVQDGQDVLMDVPASVGRPDTLRYGDREWTFVTPPGLRVVLAKEPDPIWIPPDWHFAERALEKRLQLLQLRPEEAITLGDGSYLTVKDQRVVRISSNGGLQTFPVAKDIVIGDTLVVPPFGTLNRRYTGELGPFKLDLGDGYLIHGATDGMPIGGATTHGCVQVADRHLEMLFRNVPVGTAVFIY